MLIVFVTITGAVVVEAKTGGLANDNRKTDTAVVQPAVEGVTEPTFRQDRGVGTATAAEGGEAEAAATAVETVPTGVNAATDGVPGSAIAAEPEPAAPTEERVDAVPTPRTADPAPTSAPVATREPTRVAVAPAGAGGDVRAIICSVPWPCAEALRVAFCESSLRPGAISPDGRNYGLMQVNVIHQARVGGDVSRLLDPVVNVAVAYQIYAAAGYSWQPWSCKP